MRQLVRGVLLDIICLLLLYTPWMVLKFLDKPFLRGFYCNDESLKHPFKSSTVPSTYLYIAVAIICLIIMMTEFALVHFKRKDKYEYPSYCRRVKLPTAVIYSYKHIGYFMFGCLAQQTINVIGKFSVGRLRPHFFDICKPDFENVNCTDNFGYHQYVTKYECTGATEKSAHLISEMRLSFPSGHASLSVYCAVYFCIYIHARLNIGRSMLVKPFIQMIAIYSALYVSLSRISDYKHHWSDVLAGAILGMVAAIVTATLIAKMFSKTQEKNSDKGLQNAELISIPKKRKDSNDKSKSFEFSF